MRERSISDSRRRVSPQEREAILERQIDAMACAGYRCVKRIGNVAVVENWAGRRSEIFVEGDGQIRHL